MTGRGVSGALTMDGVVRAVGVGRETGMGTGVRTGAAGSTGATLIGAAGTGAGSRVVMLKPAGVTAGTTGSGITGAGTIGTTGATRVVATVGRVAVTGDRVVGTAVAVGTTVMVLAMVPGRDALGRPVAVTTAACFGGGKSLVISASNPISNIPGRISD